MLTVLTVHRTVRHWPAFRLLMTQAFALLLTRFGIAHKTSQLYQNVLRMPSNETVIMEREIGNSMRIQRVVLEGMSS
jgi:hypothetical protein